MNEDGRLQRFKLLVDVGVPADALAFYGRWYQFETWLREVVYVELRARYGGTWTAHLRGPAQWRATGDQRNAYMASADEGDLLTYADVGDLFALVEAHWELFEKYLPPKARWAGRTDELRELRNRNAHCRRPHEDDVGRVEQVLRDLEHGARRFYASYASSHFIPQSSQDPVARAWIGAEHESAMRLLGHAESQYEVRFQLSFSVRPWAPTPDVNDIAGSEGVLWRAQWFLGPLEVDATDLWRDVESLRSTADLLVHLLPDSSSVIATFSALEPPERVADAIGDVFDRILTISRPRQHDGLTFDEVEQVFEARRSAVDRLPARVQMGTALALIDHHDPSAFSIFSAGT